MCWNRSLDCRIRGGQQQPRNEQIRGVDLEAYPVWKRSANIGLWSLVVTDPTGMVWCLIEMISEMDEIEKTVTNHLGVDTIGVVVQDKTTLMTATRHQDVMTGERRRVGTEAESTEQ